MITKDNVDLLESSLIDIDSAISNIDTVLKDTSEDKQLLYNLYNVKDKLSNTNTIIKYILNTNTYT